MKASASPFKRYNNSRHNLILVFFLSLINMFLYAGTHIYFLFSAYLPLMLIDIAGSDSRLIGFMLIFSFSYLTAYLLCYIFSKRHLGWMIAALALFAVDSVCLLINVPAHFAEGDFLILLDLLFHFYVFGSLVMGVMDGKTLKPILASNGRSQKSQTDAEPVQSEEPSGEAPAESVAAEEGAQTEVFEETSGEAPAESVATEEGVQTEVTKETRTLTIQRKKAFVAATTVVAVYVNGKEVCRLPYSGNSQTIAVPSQAFNLGIAFASGMSDTSIRIEAGESPLSYQINAKAGFPFASLELERIQ